MKVEAVEAEPQKFDFRPLEAMSLDDFGRDVARRQQIDGGADLPRNSGQRRTKSKLGLLAAIEATGANW